MPRMRVVVRWTLAAMLCAGAAEAQTREENLARCAGADAGLAIVACTALIESGGAGNEALANAYDSRGKAYATRGQLDRAISDHDQAMRLNPSHATAFVNRGTVYFRQGVYDQAIQDSRSALRINPADVDALRLRGLALARTHQHRLAIQDFDRALALKASDEIRGLRCDSLKAIGRAAEC